MDYFMKPSLECMVLTKIAVSLWNQDDIRHLLPSIHDERKIVWLKVEDKVIEKVPGLPLPQPLKKKLLIFISGIGWEIYKWRIFFYLMYSFDIVQPSQLCWTPHLTVDTKKTVEMLIENENLDISTRYRLACNCCLEDAIPKLWDKIPENLREQFYTTMELNYLVGWWTYRINGEMDKLERILGEERSPHQFAFENAASKCNTVATEYFLQRLTHEEREKSLLDIAHYVARKGASNKTTYFSDILCYLLFQMDEREQIKLFENDLQFVLNCLLKWPWQSPFMENLNRIWDILSERGFYFLLLAIVDRVNEGYRDCDYQKMFEEFWQKSPNAFKKHVIDKLKTCEFFPGLLSALFEIEDIENVRLILNSATVEERKDIIFCPNRNHICEHLVNTNKWESLKFFLQECLSSKKLMIKFKEEFKEHTVRKMSERNAVYQRNEYEWNKFFQLLDDLIKDNNKRSSEEAGENTLAKRLRDTEVK